MQTLIRLALKNRKTQGLLFLSFLTMIFMTFASQLEILSLGVLTNKGADFFSLFAPREGGQLVPTKAIAYEQMEERWHELDPEGRGEVTWEATQQFLEKNPSGHLLQRVTYYVKRYFALGDSMPSLAFFLIFVAFFRASTLFIHRFITRVIAIGISRDLRQKYFEHIETLPMEFYQKYHVGHLSSRVVGDASLIADAVNACHTNFFQTPFIVLSTLLFCFAASWQLSLIIFFGFPLIMAPIFFLANRVRKISRQIQRHQEIFASILLDFLGGIQTVKAFSMEEFSRRKYTEQNDHMAALERKSARYDLSSRPVVHTIAMLFLSSTLLYGLYFFHMSPAEVLVFCALLYLFYEPIKKFAEENAHIQRGIAAAERMEETLRQQSPSNYADGAISLTTFSSRIVFDNVWFRYQEAWVLRGISFTIERGEKVAIVGPTGAGKSTIAQLLPRLYEVEKGEIRIDDRPLGAYQQKSVRECIAYVPQKPFLFLDTIAQNIAFGRPYSLEEVREAAKAAYAEEFISRLPDGYLTELAEAGKNLSGGQQQRLAIARALIKKAPILILDEATSALDMLSEKQIQNALQALRGEVTQIIIAHRLSTIEDADRIIYLDRGEKVAEGSREELLRSCPPFLQMWEALHHETTGVT